MMFFTKTIICTLLRNKALKAVSQLVGNSNSTPVAYGSAVIGQEQMRCMESCCGSGSDSLWNRACSQLRLLLYGVI